MELLIGFAFVAVAGFLQGTFILPMTRTRRWQWEHSWATFSLLGMFVFNWLITVLLIPDIISIYHSVPAPDLLVLILFGAGWGAGAILFGIGMERLGMALGYPIIMGLIASLGALIPLLVFFPQALGTVKGLLLLAGTATVVVGIILCSKAGAQKNSAPAADGADGTRAVGLKVGLVTAVFAGILSCLPNVGMAFGNRVIQSAESFGTASAFSGNAVWALFFTVGFLVNFIYCVALMLKRGTAGEYLNKETGRNVSLIAVMALMWIGSFYLYGIGAERLGNLKAVAGWPLFISLAIGVGNLWGIWAGEWKDARPGASSLLNKSLAVLLLAVITIAVGGSLR